LKKNLQLLTKLKKALLSRITDQRDRRILFAAFTAFAAKFGGVALQLFSIPLVVRTLGVQNFSIFAIGSSIIAFVMLSNFGISGYVVSAVSAARNQPKEFRNTGEIMAAALHVTVALGLLLLLATYIYSLTFGLDNIFGGMYLHAPEVVTNVLYLILIFGVIQSTSGIFVDAQNAYQELHYSNLYGGSANFVSALAIVGYSFLANEARVLGYLLALYLPMMVCQVINSVHFLLRHPEARPQLKLVKRSLIVTALCGGGAFFIAQTVLPITIREFPKFLLAARGELDQVTTYALLMTLLTMLFGIFSSFTQPLFGGFADAWNTGETTWVMKRIFLVVAAYALSGVVLMLVGYFYGFKLTSIWVGVDAGINNRTMLLFGLFFGLVGIFNILTIALYAMNQKFHCIMINIITTICILTAVMLMGKSVEIWHILTTISLALAFIGIPMGLVIVLHKYSNSSRSIELK